MIAGVLFALLPVHVEPVANIVGRAELMCAAGVIGAIVLLLHSPLTVRRALAIFGCCVLAALSKEQGLLMPAIILLAAVLLLHPPPLRQQMLVPERESERKAWMLLTLLVCWFFAGYVVFREYGGLKFEWERNLIDIAINPLVRPDADRWLVPVAIARGVYALLLIAPLHLSPDYSGAVIGYKASYSDPFLFAGFAVIAMVVLTLTILVHRWRRALQHSQIALFCLLIACLAYGMISNFGVQIGTNFGERLIYLPSAFLTVLAAMALSRLRRAALVPLMIVLTLAMMLRSIDYARRWNDATHFYEWASEQQPKSIQLKKLIVAIDWRGSIWTALRAPPPRAARSCRITTRSTSKAPTSRSPKASLKRPGRSSIKPSNSAAAPKPRDDWRIVSQKRRSGEGEVSRPLLMSVLRQKSGSDARKGGASRTMSWKLMPRYGTH